MTCLAHFIESEKRGHRGTVYRLEKGEQLPKGDTLKTVMDTLEVPMDEMICPHIFLVKIHHLV